MSSDQASGQISRQKSDDSMQGGSNRLTFGSTSRADQSQNENGSMAENSKTDVEDDDEPVRSLKERQFSYTTIDYEEDEGKQKISPI